MEKFKKGDKVRIIDFYKYFTNSHAIPKELIIHGSLQKHQTNTDATIVGQHNEYYIVNYNDYNNNKVQLGFLHNNLELLEKSQENLIKLIEIW